MTAEADAFEKFDDELKLEPAERKKAQQCHHEIGGILDREEYTEGRFLQGSFARKTMIKPLRDIDMVVLLRPELRRYVGEELRAGLLTGASGGPQAVMERLEAALRPHYPGAVFDIGKHALGIDFGDGGFKFDVVPAFDTDGGPRSDVLIANTDAGQWQRSNTRELMATVSDRNGACNGRFIHQVRMIKHAVSESPTGKEFFGLLSESIAFDAIRTSMAHAEACLRVFERGAELLTGSSVYDPTREDNLLRRLDVGTRDAAQRQFAKWTELAREARRLAEKGDQDAAVDVWHQVFGNPFPAGAEESTAAAARAWQGGAPTATGRITTAAIGRTAAPPGRSWRSR